MGPKEAELFHVPLRNPVTPITGEHVDHPEHSETGITRGHHLTLYNYMVYRRVYACIYGLKI
jgi:hypothetical protein